MLGCCSGVWRLRWVLAEMGDSEEIFKVSERERVCLKESVCGRLR